MHHEEEVFVNQVREKAYYVFKHFFLVCCSRLHATLPQQFVSEIGEKFCHWILTNINIYEFLEGELQLSSEQRVFAETLFHHFLVIDVHIEKFFNYAWVVNQAFDVVLFALRASFALRNVQLALLD